MSCDTLMQVATSATKNKPISNVSPLDLMEL